jgi:CheY-like chemotaxis protein
MAVKKTEIKEEMENSAASSLPNQMRTILLVDDAPETRLMTKWFLSSFGYVVHAFAQAEEALAQFNPKIHDIIITDNRMPRMTGAELAHIIKMRSPSTPVVMYTGELPADRSCLDAMIQRSSPLPDLRDAIVKLLATRP